MTEKMSEKRFLLHKLEVMLGTANDFLQPCIALLKTLIASTEEPTMPQNDALLALLQKLEKDIVSQRYMRRDEESEYAGYHLILAVCSDASQQNGSQHCLGHVIRAYTKAEGCNRLLVDSFLIKCVDILQDKIWFGMRIQQPRVHVLNDESKFQWLHKGRSTVVGKRGVTCY